jgi:hypothetical protein
MPRPERRNQADALAAPAKLLIESESQSKVPLTLPPYPIGCASMAAAMRRQEGGGPRIDQIVGRDVDRLHTGDRPSARTSDPLLKLADLRLQRRLIAQDRGDASQEGAPLHPGLHEAIDVVDEEERVAVLPIAEVFGDRQGGQRDAEARPGDSFICPKTSAELSSTPASRSCR